MSGTLTATIEKQLVFDPNFPNGYNNVLFGRQSFDFSRMLSYRAVTDTISGAAGIIITDLTTMDVVGSFTLNGAYAGTPFGSPAGSPFSQTIVDVTVGNGTDIYILVQHNITNSIFVRVDASTFKVTGEYFVSATIPPPINSLYDVQGTAVTKTSTHTVVAYNSTALAQHGQAQIMDGTTMVPIGFGPQPTYSTTNNNNLLVALKAPNSSGQAEFALISTDYNGGSGNIEIWICTVNADNITITNTHTGTFNVLPYFSAANLWPNMVYYDSNHDSIIMVISNASLPQNAPVWLISVQRNGTLNWINGPHFDFSGHIYGKGQSVVGGGGGNNILFFNQNANVSILDTTSGLTTFSGGNVPSIFGDDFFYISYSPNFWYYTWSGPNGFVRYEFKSPPPPPGPAEQYYHFITCCDRAILGHLYQFTSATGINDYFTDLDLDILYNGITWKSGSLRFEGLQRKLSVGLAVDEQTLKIWAAPTDTIFGANFLAGAETGLLDGATIVRYRIVWEFVSGNVARDVQNPPIGFWPMFTGLMGQIAAGGVSHTEFKVKSALVKLNVNMPRNYYQPGCLWTLFDQGCTLPKAAYGVTSTVQSAAYNAIAPLGGVANPVSADDIATYAQGRLVFLSGVNEGLQVLVDNNDGIGLYLAYPLSIVPSVGDQIVYYPGCSKTFNTCKAKFNNQANFRGFDLVPPVVVSV